MAPKPKSTFNAQAFLNAAGLAYRRHGIVFSQGDCGDSIGYVQAGAVRFSVSSETGREAVVAMVGPGDFFGEGCLAGESVRRGTATATVDSTILLIDKAQMVTVLSSEHALSDRFIAYLLARNTRVEADLRDQMFNSSEQRLARVLLLLAQYDGAGERVRTIPPMSQQTLGDMIGTTRSRVNFFMNKFRRLGFIDLTDGIRIHPSLLTIVLHD